MSVFAEMDDCLSDMAQTEVCSNWRSLKFYINSAQERVARVRACNYVKIKTGWNFPPVLKIVTHTVQAA